MSPIVTKPGTLIKKLRGFVTKVPRGTIVANTATNKGQEKLTTAQQNKLILIQQQKQLQEQLLFQLQDRYRNSYRNSYRSGEGAEWKGNRSSLGKLKKNPERNRPSPGVYEYTPGGGAVQHGMDRAVTAAAAI